MFVFSVCGNDSPQGQPFSIESGKLVYHQFTDKPNVKMIVT